ncbi:DUF58 domain-containing protein [Brassicibacter mesophilus]|uniref:DUF58 domain-containing protein n=1 Tax=Brassicibacter mesophilus TaxID=745119 RepID=UPI003D229B91
MNKRLLVIILILCLVFALLVGGRFFYFMFFIVSSIAAYSYFSVKNVSNQLVGLCWINTNTVERDTSVEVSYKIYNSSMLPIPYVEIDYNIPHKLFSRTVNEDALTLLPFETIEVKKEVECQRRGIYHLGNIKITISDIFSLVNKTVCLKDDVMVTVYPKIYELSNLRLLGNESYGLLKSNTGHDEDYSSIRDIRKYHVGDSLKRINWKVTARKGELFIKNYDIYNNIKIRLYVDFDLDKYCDDADGLVEEKIVECAISIIKYTLTRDIPIEFTTYTEGRISMYGKNLNNFKGFLELLTTISPQKNISLKDVIDFEKKILPLSDTIIMITPRVDDRLVTLAISLKKRGHSVAVISVADFKKIQSWYNNIALLEKSAIEAYQVRIEDDIARVLR